MFVQQEYLENSIAHQGLKLPIPSKEAIRLLPKRHAISGYKTKERGNPRPVAQFDISLKEGMMCQKLRGFTHALVRFNPNQEAVTPEEQKNGAYAGFMHPSLIQLARVRHTFT